MNPGAIKSAAPGGSLVLGVISPMKNSIIFFYTSNLAVSLRAIFRSQRPRAGIFRSPYADLKISTSRAAKKSSDKKSG